MIGFASGQHRSAAIQRASFRRVDDLLVIEALLEGGGPAEPALVGF
jgi:hypothetical protein